MPLRRLTLPLPVEWCALPSPLQISPHTRRTRQLLLVVNGVKLMLRLQDLRTALLLQPSGLARRRTLQLQQLSLLRAIAIQIAAAAQEETEAVLLSTAQELAQVGTAASVKAMTEGAALGEAAAPAAVEGEEEVAAEAAPVAVAGVGQKGRTIRSGARLRPSFPT